MGDGGQENTGTRPCQFDAIDAVGLFLEAHQLRIRVCIVPQVESVVNRNPRVIQLCKKTHTRRYLRPVILIEDLVGDIIHFDFLERRP